MATYKSNVSNGYYTILTATETNVDITNNSSDVNWSLSIYCSNAYFQSNNNAVAVTINGTNVFSANVTTNFSGMNSSLFIKSGTLSGIKHNADGSKTIGVYSSYRCSVQGQSYAPQTALVANSTMKLTTIPRANTISATSAYIEETSIITIDKKSSTFRTTLQYSLDNNNFTTIVDKTDKSSVSFVIPATVYATIPNAMSKTIYFKALTYNGTILVGTTSTNCRASVRASSVAPWCNYQVYDTNAKIIALTGDRNKIVLNASDTYIKMTSTVKCSATLKSNSFKIKDKVISSSTSPLAKTMKVNDDIITFSVTDSRNICATISEHLDYVDYVVPRNTDTTRRNNPTDDKVKLEGSGAWFSGSFGTVTNTVTAKYRFKLSTSSTWGSWIELPLTTSPGKYSYSLVIADFDYQNKYNIEISVADKINTINTSVFIKEGMPVYAIFDKLIKFYHNVKVKGNLYANTLQIGSAWLGVDNNNYLAITGAEYLRTPYQGLIPNQPGSSGTLGTETWKFKNSRIENGVFDTLKCANETVVNYGSVSGKGYWLKLYNGVMIQWYDSISLPIDQSSKSITFPVPFVNTNYSVVTSNRINGRSYGTTNWISYGDKTLSTITFWSFGSGASLKDPRDISFVAIGRWK